MVGGGGWGGEGAWPSRGLGFQTRWLPHYLPKVVPDPVLTSCQREISNQQHDLSLPPLKSLCSRRPSAQCHLLSATFTCSHTCEDGSPQAQRGSPSIFLLLPQDVLEHSRSLGTGLVVGKAQHRPERKRASPGASFSQRDWELVEKSHSPQTSRQGVAGHCQGAAGVVLPLSQKQH